LQIGLANLNFAKITRLRRLRKTNHRYQWNGNRSSTSISAQLQVTSGTEGFDAMNGTDTKSTGRSIWAIVAGFLVVVVLSIGTDVILHILRVYTGPRLNDSQSALAIAYRTLFAIVGSYITARLAPYKPLKHALIGAAIGTVIATAGAVATWNKDLGPHWYPLAVILTAFPTAWIGARIWLAQLAKA
jgi:hypothetical protein